LKLLTGTTSALWTSNDLLFNSEKRTQKVSKMILEIMPKKKRRSLAASCNLQISLLPFVKLSDL